eukprot:CAMPEP_0172578338 /NCGR_PEP_ID=MMETSP1067-20121228/138686_1 /TAXON_ID=265564 ORGANISM="Thalassiosira punctigera, Strain Tpunct2005C2" /NCGR_SAMPLE_ID=MMETSP1067 /ASSEMBLY_ACC=CAM_ASM_000444 /LENGTH=368 /DNA_ID=CAMNT_0013371031 /DNA_START=4 /DNA_END=1110 /DNA_ORIENTATION=-
MKATSVMLLLHAITSGWAFQINNHAGIGAAGLVSVEKRMTADEATGAGGGATPLSSLGTSAKASDQHERRSFLHDVVAQSIVFSSALTAGGAGASAADETGTDLPKITRKVFFDVRISRADGSFYVRDSNPSGSSTDDEPLYGRLVVGLFGDRAPNHVERFLDYVDVRYDVDKPLPSYSRSRFGTLDTATGLLIGGTIPGLDVTTLAGGNVIEYSGRVFPAKLWMEDKVASDGSATIPKLSHDAKGLLTHRNLDVTPSFGITTRKTSTSLDATHTVFGRVLEDQSGILDAVVDLPVLTETGRVSRTTNEPAIAGGGGADVGGSLASSVFTAQRAIFRDAAKTFGDSRLDKVYDGKLLRRVEVTMVGVL